MRGALFIGALSLASVALAQPEEERSWGRVTAERNREQIAVLEERVESVRRDIAALTHRLDRIEAWGIYALVGTGAIGVGGGLGVARFRQNGKSRRPGGIDDTRH